MRSKIKAELSPENQLQQLIEQHYPAVKTAGFHLSPVAGLTGESWKIVSPAGNMLARHQSRERRHSGVERQREHAILRHIERQSLGPCVRLSSPPWLLVEWIAGTPLSNAAFVSAVGQKALSQSLARLHLLKPSGYPLDLRRQFTRYWQHVDRRRLTPCWLALHQKMMRRKLPVPLKMALLHMDIHAGNLLETETGLRIIDWEYAADGDTALEIAALVRGNGLDPHHQDTFIREYAKAGGYQDLSLFRQQVKRWLPWVDYLMLLWFEVRWAQTADKKYSEWAQPLRVRLFGCVHDEHVKT
ncbi:phosphotransferase [Rahnella sp. PCH160]|uniref:phosphotransferase n=1 Tax=Rahnella sp. PCH160 TaxID=3447928 RepID=UPI0039FDD0C8